MAGLGFLLKLIPGYSALVLLAQFGVGVLYPTWESFRAIETTGTKDDVQWLSYWVVLSVYSLVEKFAWPVLIWLPLYGLAKVAFLAWLVLPQFHGASFVYSEFVRPVLLLAADRAKEFYPQLEPYVRDFTSAAKRIEKKAAAATEKALKTAKADVQPKAEEPFAPLKTHAQ